MNSKIFILKISDIMELGCRFLVQYFVKKCVKLPMSFFDCQMIGNLYLKGEIRILTHLPTTVRAYSQCYFSLKLRKKE